MKMFICRLTSALVRATLSDILRCRSGISPEQAADSRSWQEKECVMYLQTTPGKTQKSNVWVSALITVTKQSIRSNSGEEGSIWVHGLTMSRPGGGERIVAWAQGCFCSHLGDWGSRKGDANIQLAFSVFIQSRVPWMLLPTFRVLT